VVGVVETMLNQFWKQGWAVIGQGQPAHGLAAGWACS